MGCFFGAFRRPRPSTLPGARACLASPLPPLLSLPSPSQQGPKPPRRANHLRRPGEDTGPRTNEEEGGGSAIRSSGPGAPGRAGQGVDPAEPRRGAAMCGRAGGRLRPEHWPRGCYITNWSRSPRSGVPAARSPGAVPLRPSRGARKPRRLNEARPGQAGRGLQEARPERAGGRACRPGGSQPGPSHTEAAGTPNAGLARSFLPSFLRPSVRPCGSFTAAASPAARRAAQRLPRRLAPRAGLPRPSRPATRPSTGGALPPRDCQTDARARPRRRGSGSRSLARSQGQRRPRADLRIPASQPGLERASPTRPGREGEWEQWEGRGEARRGRP